MRVEVTMGVEPSFEVNHWYASTSTAVINSLKKQLDAASSIWPELKNYEIKENK